MAIADHSLKLNFHDRVERRVTGPMIEWLCDGRRLRVLDAGCGSGAPALSFAELGCTLVGIDVRAESLESARDLFASTTYEDRVEFLPADMTALDFDDGSFDLVWASRSLHHVADRPGVVRELLRVLRPGGRLAIREDGLPVQMLPFDIGLGEPGLQDRLRVAHNHWFDAMTRATFPDAVPYPLGWSQLLVDNDLEDVTARTFTTDILPPFDDVESQFAVYQLRSVLDRNGSEYGPVLAEDDRQVLVQLLDPESHHYLLKRADLHIRFGLSVYVGRKPGGEGRALTDLDGVARTLLLPLRARAAEHERAGRLFADETAARWYRAMPDDAELDGWYNPAFEVSSNIRTRIIDDLARRFLKANPNGWVIEIGAGLTTRRHRLGCGRWLLVDLPPVMALLRRFEAEDRSCRLLSGDLRQPGCLDDAPVGSSEPALLIAEGVLPFLSKSQVLDLLDDLEGRWPAARLAFDLPHPVHLDMLNQQFERIDAPLRWSIEAAELSALGLEVIEVQHLLTAYPERWDEVLEVEESARVPELSPYVAFATWKRGGLRAMG